MADEITTTHNAVRSIVVHPEAGLAAPGGKPESRVESDTGEWETTLSLATTAREQIARAEERIAELEAQRQELEERLADEVASMMARVAAMDARFADMEEARIAAQTREHRANHRLASATHFYSRMNEALRIALRGARLAGIIGQGTSKTGTVDHAPTGEDLPAEKTHHEPEEALPST